MKYNEAFLFYNDFFDIFIFLVTLEVNILFYCEYMTKKEFMLQIITFLPDWKMGRGLKALIENNQLSSDVFERLYQIFRQSIHETYTEIQKAEFKEKIRKIESMKQKEIQQNQEDLVDLDTMFDTL